MRPLQSFCAALLLGSATTHGALYTAAIDSAMPEGNPAGISSTTGVSGLSPSINDVNLDTALRESSLASGNTLDANGDRTILLADVAARNRPSILARWRSVITAVPETVTVAFGTFGGVCLVISLRRYRRTSKWNRISLTCGRGLRIESRLAPRNSRPRRSLRDARMGGQFLPPGSQLPAEIGQSNGQ